MPASVTPVANRNSVVRLATGFNCRSPASVIPGAGESQPVEFCEAFQMDQAHVGDTCPPEVQGIETPRRAARCTIPLSLTCVPPRSSM